MTPTVRAPIRRLMEEARRRYESFAVRRGLPLERAWLGLGFPREYRPAVEAGLMVPLHGREEPRCMSWYLLTEKGVSLYRELYPHSEAGEHTYKDGLPIEADAA